MPLRERKEIQELLRQELGETDLIQLDDKKQLFGAVIKKLEEAGASIGIDSLRTELASLKDLMEKPEILSAAREEFSLATAEGYDCPIGKEVTF